MYARQVDSDQWWCNTGSEPLPGLTAASEPLPFTIGSAPRRITQLRQDGTHNTDISLMKNLVVWQPVKLQFRADFGSVAKTAGRRFDTLERCPSPRLSHSNGATIPAR